MIFLISYIYQVYGPKQQHIANEAFFQTLTFVGDKPLDLIDLLPRKIKNILEETARDLRVKYPEFTKITLASVSTTRIDTD